LVATAKTMPYSLRLQQQKQYYTPSVATAKQYYTPFGCKTKNNTISPSVATAKTMLYPLRLQKQKTILRLFLVTIIALGFQLKESLINKYRHLHYQTYIIKQYMALTDFCTSKQVPSI